MSFATPRITRHSQASLSIGDPVTLPNGEHGILRYVGKVQGKPGEYAGVELVGEFESQGKHSGTFEGVSYFQTARPNTGLFIVYSKLIASTSRQFTNSSGAAAAAAPTTPVRRLSLARPQLAPPSPKYAKTPERSGGFAVPQATSVRKANPPASATRKRQSFSATPKRASGIMSPPFRPPSGVREDVLASPSRNRRVSTAGAHPPPRQPQTSADSSNPSAEEFAMLTRELRQIRNEVSEKDAQLEQQGDLLRELEKSLEEFQALAEQHHNRPTLSDHGSEGEMTKLLLALEEKDRRIAIMKGEFEEKRQEFRVTIDGLQEEIQETSEMYESEIHKLKSNMGHAADINSEIIELQKEVAQLESGLRTSQVSEQNAKAQLSRLADIENRLLDKEQELVDTRKDLEYYKDLLENQNASSPHQSHQFHQSYQEEEIEQLRVQLFHQEEEIQQLRVQLAHEEKENEQLRAQLSHEEKETEQLRAQLSHEGKETEQLRVQLSHKEEEIEQQLRTQLAHQEEEAQQLRTQLAHQKEENGRVQLSHHDEEIEQLQAQLEEERAWRDKSEKEIENLESMLESKIFRESELERELESLKISHEKENLSPSTLSSPASDHTKPVTPKDMANASMFAPQQPPQPIVSPAKVDPAAGRKLWCGLCEREGHESLDCPFEEEEF
ncbi:hypothetical protein TRVA0_001S02520 [Trichomonascus vanleenenianus]|uniref:uncharacterized protein n=1 Tax=Trichomonascus vanleenenianus TaxID=2268995 RepID=UPI003ECB7FEB